MKIYESAENYLESILMLKKEKGKVRSIDIAQKLGFSKPSVSRAMSLLRQNGCVVMDKEGFLELTEEGTRIAQNVYERHVILTEFLVSLGVEKEIAAEDACKIEHFLSEQSFSKIKEVVEKNKA